MFVWFVLSERKSVRIGLPTALSQLFLATFGNALCKDVAPIGVFGGVCLQAAARDFQCASVRLRKGLIFDKRRSCHQKHTHCRHKQTFQSSKPINSFHISDNLRFARAKIHTFFNIRQLQKFFQKIQKCHFRFVIRVIWH